ncbi:MAG: NADPH:quinone oxidoreductase family protein [Hyphomicrobiaceae bacterium]
MRCVVASDFGGIDALRLEILPPPPLTSGSVRISTRAAGISFANLLVIEGKHQNTPSPPFTPGTEIAGIITEIAGNTVNNLNVGDRVCAGLQSGGFADQAVVPADNVFKIPNNLDFDAATHFPTIYATAYAALAWRAALLPGEVLLVHGAAGASGLAAVEIGRALGARVIATAGGPEKTATARAHGADHAIDSRDGDIREAVLELTDGHGVDVVFDPVGGEIFDQSLRCVAPLARLIPMGFASGQIPQIPANLILVKNLTVIGLYWGYYMAWGKTKAGPALRAEVRTLFDELFVLFEQGALHCTIDSALPLAEFALGLRRVSGRSVIGKVVLNP